MIVERSINGVHFAVNVNKPNEVYFDRDYIKLHPEIAENITAIQLCKLISKVDYTPLLMSWELLDKCSFSCPFCYIVGHSNKKLVRFSKIKPHLKEIIDKGLLYCTLTGGEATLHPDFIEIYTYLKKCGVIVEIFTNGSLLSQKHIELFKKYPPYKIEISIYGISSQQFAIATGNKKFDYQTILDNILLLKKNGINIQCKTPVNKTTEGEFLEIQKWCLNNNITFYYSTAVYNAYDGNKLNDFSIDFDKRVKFDTQKILQVEKAYPEKMPYSPEKGKSCYTCSIRNFGFHINTGFELMPCSETHFEESKSKILETGYTQAVKKYRSFVEGFVDKPIIGCSGCEASQHCKMCTAKAIPMLNEYGNVSDFKVPDEHCDNERRKVREINELLLTSF